MSNAADVTLTAEQIQENFNKYRSLCEKIVDRSPAALAMVDGLGERLAVCPASGKKDYHRCTPGGLVEHSLRVLQNAMTLSRAFGWQIPRSSLIIGALFHDLGKVGNHESDYYIPAEGWRAEKLGELYTYNKEIQYMTVPLRGLFLCQHYGLKLTEAETLAIFLNDGQYAPENAPYKLKEPMLADVVHMSDLIATKQEKGMLPL